MTNQYPSYGSGTSGGTGATSLVVTSPDDSIIQEGSSSYNPTLSQLTIALRAVGGGGMTNPMIEAGDLIIGGTPVSGVAPPTRLPKGIATQVLTIDATTNLPVWGDNFGLKQYAQEKYVDNANGDDINGDGSYAKPWKTIAHSLTVIPENSTLFVMSSNVDETTIILTANANIHISAFGNREVNIPQFVVNSTVAGSVSFSGVTIGGLAIQPTTICDVYLNNCILTDSINKRGAGYLECNFVDASIDSTSIRSGTFSAFGGKFSDLTLTLTGDTPPIATFNNCKLNGVINVQDGATLTLINNLITGTTEDAVIYSDTGFGTVVNMIGNELYTASGAPAAVSVDTYTLYNQIFDKENSTFGTSSSDTSWFDKLGITTTETITTATTMLVRNADGSIAEQLIPSGGAYQYSKIRYVDPVNGNDITGNGAYGNPWKTVAHAVNAVSSGMIICLMGNTTEVAFSISKTNLDIIALGTRSALNGFTNLVTITGTGAGSIRFQDINFAAGLTRQAASTCGLYVYNGSIGSNGGFNQHGNGYTEFVGVDASNSLHGIGSGTFNVFGGKITFPTITGSTASVTFDNVDYIAGNGTSTTAAMINILESNWIAGATGFALEVTDINAVTTIQGCNIIRPDGATLAPVSLTLFDIQDTDFNRDESSLGMHVGNTDWFSKLGLVVEPNIVTTSDYYLTLVAGILSKQRQATQVNLPATSMYSSTSSVQNVDFKTSGGVSVYTHPAQLCSTTGAVVFNEFFNLHVPVSSQFRAKGSFMLYNVSAIASATYQVSVSLLALSEAGGALTILGSPAVFTLNKASYAYNPISFDALVPSSPSTYTQLGIRITITGAESGKTALINSLFAEYILS